MEAEGSLQRTPSDTSCSTSSSQKDKSRTVRTRRGKHAAKVKSILPKSEDKSLTSFPSLSPENSPRTVSDGKVRSMLAEVDANQGTKKPLLKQKRSIVAALTAKSPSARGRGSLFEDSPTSAVQEVPGSIHYSSDAHIERLIARQGAVALVRQLAEDLANREAELSSFRHRTELRERELKKMLREVEVSNMDIEARIHQLEQDTDTNKTGKESVSKKATKSAKRTKEPASGPPVGAMVEEAIEDAIASEDDFTLGSISRDEEDRQATIRAKAIRDPETVSTTSSHETSASKGTTRGWKDYIWSGTGTHKPARPDSAMSIEDRVTARKDGIPQHLRRKGLDQSLFKPPSINEDETAGAETASQASDKQRAASMTSWTMKIFGGSSQGRKDSMESGTVRGRASTSTTTQVKESRGTSQASRTTTTSAKASLMKTDSRARRSVTPLSFGPNGTLKSSASSASNVPLASPKAADETNNLGPVEMDAILPRGSKPPTLTPSYHNIDDASDLLTDRFGFIYDQRRRKKEAQALARVNAAKDQPAKETLAGPIDNVDAESLEETNVPTPESPTSTQESIEERPQKKWQDYLKFSNFPTELLSHTPSTSTIMTISNPDIQRSLRRTSTMEGIRESQTASTPNPLPATSSITASNAEIASPLIGTPITPITPARAEFEPVKALLAQLTELHDGIQRDKTVKWNEFLRKVRVERRKEGESGSAESRTKNAAMPEASLIDGETIGIATLGNKGKIGRAKYREFKTLVLAGIPVALRAKVWAECSGASALRVPGYYADLVNKGDDDPIILAQIQMDINRTLTDNVYFRRGPGVDKLNEVLLAYSRRNPEVGYCQGMNLITASLLLIMPTAEDAFWVLVSMIENILPRHYYDNSLLTSRADQQVLRQYVRELLPRLSAHLDELSIDLEALTFQWFLSLFTDCLSAEALYRVWDVLICCKDEEGNGGSTFLFQVALALLKLNETQLVACDMPGEVYAYLGGEITNHAISIDGLIKASEGLKTHVRRADVEERRDESVRVEEERIEERERIRNGSGGSGKEDEGDMQVGGEEVAGLKVQAPMPVEDRCQQGGRMV